MIEIIDYVSDLRAQISPERGGMVTSLQLAEREVLYLDRATFDDPAKNVRGGIPVLFPICGPLADGVWRYAGKEYRMPQHGLARQASWEVRDQQADSVELSLKSNRHTLEQYPFEFELQFHYLVEGRTLSIVQKHLNRGTTPMPFQTGLHPYFLVPSEGPLEWELPVTHWRDNENQTSGSFHGNVPEDLAVLDWEFSGISAPRARVQDIRLHYDQHYRNLVVWHVAGKPFWCLEPWSGPRFGLQNGVDVLSCPAGEEIVTRVEIQL